MICKNCGQEAEGNYCSHCGQSTGVGKLTASGFFRELFDNTFQLNRGLFFTMRELLLRPGSSMREYLAGKRKSHIKPVAFVLALSTLYFLASRITGVNTLLDDAAVGFTNASADFPIPLAIDWFIENYAYTTLLLLPFFSLLTRLTFFRSKTTYIEHLALNTYITGEQTAIYLLFTVVRGFIESNFLELAGMALAISFNFYVFLSFFHGNRLLNFLAVALAYILYLLLFVGLILGILAIQYYLSGGN